MCHISGEDEKKETAQLYQKAVNLGYADGYYYWGNFIYDRCAVDEGRGGLKSLEYFRAGVKLGSGKCARKLSVSIKNLPHRGRNNLEDFALAAEQAIVFMDRLSECIKLQEFVALRCRHYQVFPELLKNLSLARAINHFVGLDKIERYRVLLKPDYDHHLIVETLYGVLSLQETWEKIIGVLMVPLIMWCLTPSGCLQDPTAINAKSWHLMVGLKPILVKQLANAYFLATSKNRTEVIQEMSSMVAG